MCAGIDDFPYVNEKHIKAALPFLKSAGVPYYVHAELKPSDDSPVHNSQPLPFESIWGLPPSLLRFGAQTCCRELCHIGEKVKTCLNFKVRLQ